MSLEVLIFMSEKPRVYITDFINDDLSAERGILGDLADVRALGAERESQLEGRIEDAACIMIYHFLSVRAATIARLTQCKLIVRCGVGIDNVDWAAARAQGIPVCNVPDYGTEDVADTAIAMLSALSEPGQSDVRFRQRAFQDRSGTVRVRDQTHRLSSGRYSMTGLPPRRKTRSAKPSPAMSP
jgi:D-3-phosphoglycerate dehydrogenase/C-terminal binding protein